MTFIQIHSVQRPMMINWKMITHSALEMIMENEKIIKTADSYIGGERDRESDTVNVYVWCRFQWQWTWNGHQFLVFASSRSYSSIRIKMTGFAVS